MSRKPIAALESDCSWLEGLGLPPGIAREVQARVNALHAKGAPPSIRTAVLRLLAKRAARAALQAAAS